MRRLLPLLVTLLALTVPATASASFADAITRADALAPQAFSDNRCAGRVQVVIQPLAVIRTTVHADDAHDSYASAVIGDPACVINFADVLTGPEWEQQVCSLYLHELGHLNGLPHVHEPGALMSHTVPLIAACAPAAATVGSDAYYAAVDARDTALNKRDDCRHHAKRIKRSKSKRRARALRRCRRIAVPPMPALP